MGEAGTRILTCGYREDRDALRIGSIVSQPSDLSPPRSLTHICECRIKWHTLNNQNFAIKKFTCFYTSRKTYN